jgi:hypothetical protein
MPRPIHAAALQARVLTTDITNLLFAANRVAILAPVDRLPQTSRAEDPLTAVPTRSILDGPDTR